MQEMKTAIIKTAQSLPDVSDPDIFRYREVWNGYGDKGKVSRPRARSKFSVKLQMREKFSLERVSKAEVLSGSSG